MGRLRAASLLLAALAVGLVVAGCGGGAQLLPGTTADQITSNLDQVRESVQEGNCEKAKDAVVTVSTEVDELHKVDKKLKAALEHGALKLSQVVSTCGQAEEEAEEKKAGEELEEQEQIESEAVEAEEEAIEKEQKAEERAEKEKPREKAEKEAEQPEPPTGGEESGPSGEAKGQEEETVPSPSEEEEAVPPPAAGGGAAGGIGPGAPVEGGE